MLRNSLAWMEMNKFLVKLAKGRILREAIKCKEKFGS